MVFQIGNYKACANNPNFECDASLCVGRSAAGFSIAVILGPFVSLPRATHFPGARDHSRASAIADYLGARNTACT